jgi:hypothetical protein
MHTTSALGILVFMLLLQLKHAVIDGPLQTRWMLTEKGTYGKSGGLAHAGLHGLGSLVALALFGVGLGLTLVLTAVDTVIHYHVDFTKEAMVARRGWTTHDTFFWWTLAADQLFHHLTYIAIAAAVVLWS